MENDNEITMHVLLIQHQIKKRDELSSDKLYERLESGVLSKNDFIILERIFAEVFKFTLIRIDQEKIKKILSKFFESHKINVDMDAFCSGTSAFYAKLRSKFSNLYRKRKENAENAEIEENKEEEFDFEKEMKEIIGRTVDKIHEKCKSLFKARELLMEALDLEVDGFVIAERKILIYGVGMFFENFVINKIKNDDSLLEICQAYTKNQNKESVKIGNKRRRYRYLSIKIFFDFYK
uniref:Uncharacterized protein n=1 Tax=Strongyloides papillosus TaxID=174720 RepID=A0A0N5BGM1_STREA